MFRRKLIALNHHQPDSFNADDVNEFRNLIIWLEDQKVRHYKIEDRAGLRNIASDAWVKAFESYLTELGCPYPVSEKNSILDWLLGYAVRLEYGDEVDKFRNIKPQCFDKTDSSQKPQGQSSNPIDNLNFDDPDFKAGVASLALLLQVPPYHDHLEQLKAICLIVKEKLSKEAVERASKSHGKIETLPIDKTELGFDTGDYIINEAAKILRLLHIKDLRELQSQINQAIVAVQAITANPKTDSRLGKIGRS